MSYSITIGNAVPEHSKEYGELYARWTVESASSSDAPTFPHDEMTGNGNSRHPAYSAWHEFCAVTGLEAMWYDKGTGLLREHPGCFVLEPHHHATAKDALERWREKATLPPGFFGFPEFDKETSTHKSPDEGKYDPILARLIWMEWWMAWALKNCETPAVCNT
jgi:hypothetical protein